MKQSGIEPGSEIFTQLYQQQTKGRYSLMKTDIEIAQETKLLPITEVAEQLDMTMDDLGLYGKYKVL